MSTNKQAAPASKQFKTLQPFQSFKTFKTNSMARRAGLLRSSPRCEHKHYRTHVTVAIDLASPIMLIQSLDAREFSVLIVQ